MQQFFERKKGVYVSDKIVYQEDKKTVCKVKSDTELEIASDWPFTRFRFMPFSRLYTELEENQMTFLSPNLWMDPFESKNYLSSANIKTQQSHLYEVK